MCVLSALINNGTVSMRLIVIGNAFHNRGPTTLNERSPKLTSFVRGTSNRCCCEERVRPVEQCLFSISARYRGAVPVTAASRVAENRCHGLSVYPVCVCNTVRLGQVRSRHNLKPSGTRFKCVSGLSV